jgi:hypothetical protein
MGFAHELVPDQSDVDLRHGLTSRVSAKDEQNLQDYDP